MVRAPKNFRHFKLFFKWPVREISSKSWLKLHDTAYTAM